MHISWSRCRSAEQWKFKRQKVEGFKLGAIKEQLMYIFAFKAQMAMNPFIIHERNMQQM